MLCSAMPDGCPDWVAGSKLCHISVPLPCKSLLCRQRFQAASHFQKMRNFPPKKASAVLSSTTPREHQDPRDPRALPHCPAAAKAGPGPSSLRSSFTSYHLYRLISGKKIHPAKPGPGGDFFIWGVVSCLDPPPTLEQDLHRHLQCERITWDQRFMSGRVMGSDAEL